MQKIALMISILVHLFVSTADARLSPSRNGGISLHINNKISFLNIRGGANDRAIGLDINSKISLLNIRGGDITEKDINKHDSTNLSVEAVLIPRDTSFLKPVRFLLLLLLNMSFNSCLQTKGKPFEDTIRRILGMQTPSDENDFASKVTPLHTYVARKIRSSSSTTSEMIPPSHLPAPLPLLALLLSIIFCIGGTILLPRWSVGVDVLFNYKQFDVQKDRQQILDASYALQQWFEDIDTSDSYYATSKSKKEPSVLVYDKETQKSIICPLLCSLRYNDDGIEDDKHLQHPSRYYFELNNSRYYYDATQSQCIVSGGPNLHKAPISLLQDKASLGLQSNAQLEYAQERYLPYADISIPVPSLRDAFVQRLTSPLISLQLLGKLLSLIEEESIGRALANLIRLGFQHLTNANRGIATAKHLAEEVKDLDKTSDDVNETSRFWALCPVESEEKGIINTEWIQVSPKELLPGDLFVIASADSKQHGSSLPIPVDALLLDGTCVTEEAALTGESIPQAKVPLEFSDATVNDCTKLDMSGIHRNSCIFSGTKLLYSSTWDEDTADDSSLSTRFNVPPLPFTNDPALFLALRSGAYSSRGEIIQSLLKSRTSTGISGRKSDAESMKLIGSLALFAVGACVFLLLESTSDHRHPSVFKLIVQCTRILIASVPSDLPSSLSASAHTCANNLREMYNVVNSNTEALIESSQIDTVVFDKTGTLTADTQSLTTIVYPPDKQHSKESSSLEILSQIVLAGSHSLVGTADDEGETSLIGDPLDLACLQSTKWQYDSHEKSALSNDDSVKLWQIRTFPFDPTTKMSSAIVLVKGKDDVYQLFIVVKGSPNKIRDLVVNEDGESWYESKVKRLGRKGYRTISLGALDASTTSLSDLLFPSGLPKNESKETLEAIIHKARSLARSEVVRNDIETKQSTLLNAKDMMFVGFACFNAPMRVASQRVVKDLKKSEIDVIMLTGDEPYTSLAMASKAGITKGKQTCLLKTDNSRLVWEINKKARHFSLTTAKRVQRQVESGESVFVVTGNAVNSLLSKTTQSKASQYVKEYILPQTKVIASASPNDKSLFVHWLKNSCNRQTLMCGDGVNDIKAMQQASVSIAMLCGFRQEIDEKDTEDIRRQERLKRRLNGSNRMTSSSPSSPLDQAGIGDSVEASIARIRSGINEGIYQLENEDSDLPQHTTAFDICVSSIRAEIKRYRDMRKGGTAAAKILAQEDRLRKSMESKSNIENELHETSDEIQAGESCLASSFTLLRPCISGVESILRTGISFAACCIAIYRTVALNCMLTSYNLATLYKNGLRYGKIMWQIELWSSVYMDNASFMALSSPRPKLVAGVRPSKSPFHPAVVVSTVLQALIHIITLTCAVNLGKQLESKYPTTPQHKGFSIKWSNDNKSASVGGLLNTLVGNSAASNTSLHSDTDSVPKSFFKRTPFQPNYIANNVFIMSIFQAAVTTMVNHSGKPFSIGFLESRSLCLSVCSIFLLCIVCVSGSIPKLNSFIELAPYPTKASRIALLRLLLLNVSLSYFAEYFSMFFFRHDVWKERNKQYQIHQLQHTAKPSSMSAAEEEEKLLSEEHEQNVKSVTLICLLILYFSLQILV